MQIRSQETLTVKDLSVDLSISERTIRSHLRRYRFGDAKYRDWDAEKINVVRKLLDPDVSGRYSAIEKVAKCYRLSRAEAEFLLECYGVNYNKLSDSICWKEEIVNIKSMLSDGNTLSNIGAFYGVTKQRISKVLKKYGIKL